VKSMKLVLLMSCDGVAVRLLPWLLATSQHELLLTQLIVDSPLVHSQPLFHCIDEGMSLLLILTSYDYLLVTCCLNNVFKHHAWFCAKICQQQTWNVKFKFKLIWSFG